MSASIVSPCPPTMPSLRENTQDTRYYDLSPNLAPIDDQIANIETITVVRQDGGTIVPNVDLTISPTVPSNPDVIPPWAGEVPGPTPELPSPYPGKLFAVFWWEGAAAPTTDDTAIVYLCRVEITTEAGRALSFDFNQAVVPRIG